MLCVSQVTLFSRCLRTLLEYKASRTYQQPYRQTQHAGEPGWLAKITYQQPTDWAAHNEFFPLGFAFRCLLSWFLSLVLLP